MPPKRNVTSERPIQKSSRRIVVVPRKEKSEIPGLSQSNFKETETFANQTISKEPSRTNSPTPPLLSPINIEDALRKLPRSVQKISSVEIPPDPLLDLKRRDSVRSKGPASFSSVRSKSPEPKKSLDIHTPDTIASVRSKSPVADRPKSPVADRPKSPVADRPKSPEPPVPKPRSKEQIIRPKSPEPAPIPKPRSNSNDPVPIPKPRSRPVVKTTLESSNSSEGSLNSERPKSPEIPIPKPRSKEPPPQIGRNTKAPDSERVSVRPAPESSLKSLKNALKSSILASENNSPRISGERPKEKDSLKNSLKNNRSIRLPLIKSSEIVSTVGSVSSVSTSSASVVSKRAPIHGAGVFSRNEKSTVNHTTEQVNEEKEKLRQEREQFEKERQDFFEFQQNEKIRVDGLKKDVVLEMKIKDVEKRLKLTLPAEYPDRLMCYKDIIRELKKRSFRKNARRLFLFICVAVEFGLTDILGVACGGFADDQLAQVRDYDDILDDLGEKWFFGEGASMPPEMRIGMLFSFNLFLFIISNYAIRWGIGADAVNTGKTTVKDLVAKTFLIDDKEEIPTTVPEDDVATVQWGAWKVFRALKPPAGAGPSPAPASTVKPAGATRPRGPIYTD